MYHVPMSRTIGRLQSKKANGHMGLMMARLHVVTRRQRCLLCNQDIDNLSEWLEQTMREMGIESKGITRVRLLMEDMLLNLQGHFGSDQEVLVTFESRFGRTQLRIEARNKPYNPLTDHETQLGEWESILNAAIGIPTQYSYASGTNIIRLLVPTMHMNPVMKLAVFAVMGVALGVLGSTLMSDVLAKTVSGVFLEPLYEMWLRMLNAISGPIVFLTVTSTMINMQGVDAKGGDSKRGIIRYFVLSMLIVTAVTVPVGAVHPLERSQLSVDADLTRTLIGNILSVVPSNVFDPFVESNTSQLLFLAFTLGYLLMKLGNGRDTLRNAVLEANTIGLRLAGWASRLVPIFMAVFLCLKIISSQADILVGIWHPLGLSVVMSIIVMLVMLSVISIRMRVSPLLIAKKLCRPFLVAIRTGTLDQSFGEMLDSNTRLLGINRSYSQEAAPQGLVLYMPISTVGTITFTIYVAQVFGVQSTIVWYVSAIVMAVVVFVATPPVPGANLLAYVVLFSTLGIPADALIDAMIFDVLFGILAGAANQAMLQLEMILQADYLGLLDRDQLAAPL